MSAKHPTVRFTKHALARCAERGIEKREAVGLILSGWDAGLLVRDTKKEVREFQYGKKQVRYTSRPVNAEAGKYEVVIVTVVVQGGGGAPTRQAKNKRHRKLNKGNHHTKGAQRW